MSRLPCLVTQKSETILQLFAKHCKSIYHCVVSLNIAISQLTMLIVAILFNSTGCLYFLFVGGTPTSLNHTGEQWDFPNAWPPLQSIIVMGLYWTDVEEAIDFAQELANRWLHSNYAGYADTGEMYEKVSFINEDIDNLSIYILFTIVFLKRTRKIHSEF